MRVVLDANVIISGTITPEGQSGRILEAWRDNRFTLCTESRIVDEVERTLVELADRYQRVPDRIAPLIAELQVIAATSTIPTEPIHVVRDPKDNMVIECAVACEADLVVTNDDDLLALKSYESIGIVGIRDFVRTPGVS